MLPSAGGPARLGRRRLRPAQLIVLSFVLAIALGTALLLLPIALPGIVTGLALLAALGEGEEAPSLATARAVAALAARIGCDMPIAAMVASLAEGRMTVDDAVLHLMTRPLKEE